MSEHATTATVTNVGLKLLTLVTEEYEISIMYYRQVSFWTRIHLFTLLKMIFKMITLLVFNDCSKLLQSGSQACLRLRFTDGFRLFNDGVSAESVT